MNPVVLQYLSGAEFGWVCHSDGRIEWDENILGVRPTDAEIEAAKLPAAKFNATNQVKAAARSVYAKYATDAPGKDAVYTDKYAESQAYSSSAEVGLYMQARIDLTGENPAEVAGEWNALGAAWRAIAAQADAVQDNAKRDIDAIEDSPTAVEDVESIAATAIATLDGL